MARYETDDETTPVELSNRDIATILCALRVYQHNGMAHPAAIAADMEDIETNGGKHQPMDACDIDELCERINC